MVSGATSKEDLKYIGLRAKKEIILAKFELEQLKVNNILAAIELKIHKKEKEDRITKARAEQKEILEKINELRLKESKRESKAVYGKGGYMEEYVEQIKFKGEEKDLKLDVKDKLKEIRMIQKQ